MTAKIQVKIHKILEIHLGLMTKDYQEILHRKYLILSSKSSRAHLLWRP